VITGDVEPGELAVSRARQRNVAGWVARKRAGTKTAAAAEAAQPRREPAEPPPERPEAPPNGTPGEGAE
jgi:bifunctional UDP-N-acetylglucosamine pyrophosphorylase / glucosamine-1-phosphate N-acetyltransferase